MKHDFQNLSEVFEYSIRKFSKRPVSAFTDGLVRYTYNSFGVQCSLISKMLSNFGIHSYDKVAIFSQNMPNWTVAFFAVTAFGRIAVPMLTELSENEIRNILIHSDSKALFVSGKLFPKVPKDIVDRLKIVICTDDFSVLKADDADYTCDGTISRPVADDIAALFYTSGTTGSAKGVMLSHRNLCMNIRESWDCHHVSSRDVFLSVLPMAHTYELSVGVLYPFSVGAKVFYLDKPPVPSVLMSAMKNCRPTTMLTVPLIIEKIYRKSIVPTIGKSRTLTWMKKYLPFLMYSIIGSRLKKSLGGRMKFFGIGGAKLDTDVEIFLKKARFPYAIGYGLTEAAPLIGGANPSQTHVGSFGKPFPGVEVRLDNVNQTTGEGELVVRGDNVMRGYYKDYYRTSDVLDADGWLHTGDIASCDKKGRYYIKGRIGSLILGPSGENIYPEEIESVLNEIEWVSESLIVEDDGKLVAMVHLNDNVLNWDLEAEDKFIANMEELRKNILEYVNARVNKNSHVSRVEIHKEPFIKTATHKIRRFLYKEKKNASSRHD